jgi:hypothetical protein
VQARGEAGILPPAWLATAQKWRIRELERKIKSALFERTVLGNPASLTQLGKEPPLALLDRRVSLSYDGQALTDRKIDSLSTPFLIVSRNGSRRGEADENDPP